MIAYTMFVNFVCAPIASGSDDLLQCLTFQTWIPTRHAWNYGAIYRVSTFSHLRLEMSKIETIIVSDFSSGKAIWNTANLLSA